MPSKVYNNITGHRALDNGKVCEDVTSVAIPTVSHPTSTINSPGMAMDVDIPNTTHLEAMEFGISHNNGLNCNLLGVPGKHSLEVRAVREKYNVSNGNIEQESVKWRITGAHKSTEKGNIETGNPFGSTEKYSVLRFEEIVDGKQTVLIDAMAGIIKFNGKSYSDSVENLLK